MKPVLNTRCSSLSNHFPALLASHGEAAWTITGLVKRKLLEEDAMNDSHSDALVFFGATGDLAYKKIFPSLQAMVKRGTLDVPVVGVAKSGWNLDQFHGKRALVLADEAAAGRRVAGKKKGG
jgi:hypothetical protein